MKDNALYVMQDSTEYEANLFAADLLLADEDLADKTEYEDLDYFGLCSSLNVPADLMSFKLFSLMKRGHGYIICRCRSGVIFWQNKHFKKRETIICHNAR